MPFKLKNFTMDKFNRDVNASGNLRLKYEKWKEYRKNITSFIEGAFMQDPDMKSAIVFGAGNLNDLDMSFLCLNLDRIVLSDADTESIIEGIERQKISTADLSKIEIVKADYTGAQKYKFFNKLEDLAKKRAATGEIVSFIRKSLSEMKPEMPAEEFDLVVSCPVYTQLVYTQMEVFLKILHEYGLYELNELNKMLSAAYNAMPQVIENYNELLINSCNKQGFMVVFTDVIEMQANSRIHKKMRKLMVQIPLDIAKIEQRIKKHGIELAQIGCDNFTSKTKKLDRTYSYWPFSSEKEYLVYGILSKK